MESPKAGELDLTLTEQEAESAVGTWTPTLDAGVKLGLGDGVTLGTDVKVDPLDPEQRSVSLSISKRFRL